MTDLSVHPHKETRPEVLQEDEQVTIVFCRALYDYTAHDASALSFKGGDVIEILSREQSGWWDGLLGERRGWFPFNYVEVISDEEAERVLLTSESSGPETLDLSYAMTLGSPSLAGDGRFENEIRSPKNGRKPAESAQSSDFWMPEVTPDGQIFYKNTQTGQRSRDIPNEVVYDISNTNMGELPHLLSRQGGSGGLGHEPIKSPEPTSRTQNNIGFGVSRRDGTPEPWVRRLHDDGRSYYFYNKMDGQLPQDPGNSPSHLSPSSVQLKLTENRHLIPVDPVMPHYGPAVNYAQPTKPLTETDARRANTTNRVLDHTASSEAIDRSLQMAIAPPSAELVTELASVTKSAIQAIVASIQSNRESRRHRDQRSSHLVGNVVQSVRNLLYTFGVPTLPIPPNLLPEQVNPTGPSPSESSIYLAQRKVVASLSRLIFSVPAMQNDPHSAMTGTLAQMQADAKELEQDITSFVLEVHQIQPGSEPSGVKSKRLQGVLCTDIGPGFVGAGAAGRWKGFGWVQLSDNQVFSQRVLGPSLISELRRRLNNLDVQFQYLSRELQVFVSVEQVRLCGQELVSQTSSILTIVSEIRVARHVDVDELQQDGSASNGSYGQTIGAARRLVRTLEAIVQAMYDDIALFLLTMQSLRSGPCASHHRQERDQLMARLDGIASSLGTNTSVLLDSLGGLLSLGHEQAEMASGDYYGSVEWRASRSSGRSLSNHTMSRDGTQIVNMEMAFLHGPEKSPQLPQPVDTIPSHSSSSSRDPSHMTTGFEPAVLVQEEREWELVPATMDSPGLDEDGDDYVLKVAADLKPSYLRPNYKPEDIVIDPDNTVRGGTLSALVECLTPHENFDPSFNRAFLTTFKLFTRVDQLFDLLVARFGIEPPLSLNPSELEDWDKHKRHPIQIRVINMFVTMLKDNEILDREDFRILERMRSFVLSDEVSQFGAAKQVLVYIDRLFRNDNVIRTIPQLASPPPIFPKMNIQLKFGDIDPLELARQLTMLESDLFQKIPPMECLQRAREQRTESPDNITPIIQTSNRIADWVADLILSKDDSRKRVAILKQLIVLADFIHDGNPDTLPGGLVNFRKHQMASDVVNDIKHWKSQPFNFQVIPSVRTYIEQSLNRYIDTKASAEHFWALSLEREPRERDDERMARLLQETGFL
ncbi:hypothetical protein C0991_002353 [Blastosporella zonata]|nr:hypothetical protein C0991_002353 [Blastosporella zonata]